MSVQVPKELDEFVESALSSLAARYNVKPPRHEWSSLEGVAAYLLGNTVTLPKRVAEAWEKDRREAERMLLFLLCHEFRHYLTYAKHLKIPLPKGHKWREARRAWAEEEASRFAELESKVSKEEFLQWWNNLVGRDLVERKEVVEWSSWERSWRSGVPR